MAARRAKRPQEAAPAPPRPLLVLRARRPVQVDEPTGTRTIAIQTQRTYPPGGTGPRSYPVCVFAGPAAPTRQKPRSLPPPH